MIPKSYEKTHGDTFVTGGGRPFEMPERYPIEKNDEERQRKLVIDLDDLNGQDGGKGMPKNFVKRAGRTLDTFTDYWVKKNQDVQDEEDYDIQ
jgi:hypothetical protein